MLPVVDKPGIQYVIEEAVHAGITDVLIVSGRSKKVMEDHFDRSPELEAALERSGKHDMAKQLQQIAELANIHFVRQHSPRGLGHAIGMARSFVGNEPFVVLLPDDLMAEDSPVLEDMISAHARTGASVVAVKRFGPNEISMYGVIDPIEDADEPGLLGIHDMVEKPAAADAPSDFAIMGRYLLTPAIFDCIHQLAPGAGGEYQLTDAMRSLLTKEKIFGLPFDAGRYDTGSKLDWLRATVELALKHPELGEPFRGVLNEIARREGIG